MRRNVIFSVKLFFLLMFILGLSSCASVFKGMRSSSTKHVNKAPYYEGTLKTMPLKVVHFPVSADNRLRNAFMDRDRRFVLEPLIWEMNKYLDSLKISTAIPALDLKQDEAPDIYVGNEYADFAPTNRIGVDEDESSTVMVVYKYDPSKTWKEMLKGAMIRHEADHVLFITIGFSEYFLRHKNIFGKVVLDLGTGHQTTASWFTDMETPAEVLHVAGALLNREGKIVRAGAEGIVAKKTGFFTNALGMRDILSEEDLKKILQSEKRTDLPGKPLKWKVALNNLVAQLMEKKALIVK
ncbi:MAG: hypothetical protein V2J62_03895 [candidate division KSB1 bacterium]|jgi:hypothetical protein|nr:hypothetical protein [candidate division KSB1 bacterium]